MFQNKHYCTVDNIPFENVHGCNNKITLSRYTAPLRSCLDNEVNHDHVQIRVETG